MDTNTGEIIELDEAKLAKLTGKEGFRTSADILRAMDARGLVPVAGLPSKSCKKCHGVGHLGRNVLTDRYLPCVCIKVKKSA